ncbi:outer membrane lipoprotein [Bordetella ansorpii]|uniref:Outer membrane lipoprotein Blc n=1 Tax=Bordetella ansorpii TaxID=288768 RepID=A0A157SHQ9_9BORD|nr:lipocalin family protein [Bordetella ansorpii]SAI69456.1 outer membrane lipoprotein [Bordetella ansorpii]
MKGPQRSLAATLVAWLLGGCSSPPPMPPVAQVDLPRFMGDWYVIAHIPSFPERNAYNAIETYKLDEDGRIRTTFRYRDGSYYADVDTMHPVGTVRPGTNNAIWGMQFIWPIKAEYVIAYLDPDYRQTIVARSKRDYVWIMARTPTLPDTDYTRLVDKVKSLGYDVEKLRRVPQRWPEEAPR